MSGKANGTVKPTTPATVWAEYENLIIEREPAKARYLQIESRLQELREQIDGPKSTALVSNGKETRAVVEEAKQADPVLVLGDAPKGRATGEEEGGDRLKRIKSVLSEVHFRTREPLNELMKLFVKRGEPMTRGDVATSLKLNPKTASQRLARAVALGIVKHDGRNNYGLA